MERKPSVELQSLMATSIRMGNTRDDNFKMNNLLKGFNGELEFDRWIERYGDKNWIYLKDIRIGASVPTQIDAMVLTPSGIHVYDVKNYDAKCSYFNQVFSINNKEASHNIFTQAESSHERIKSVCRAINYEGPINFKVVFINDHCQMDAESDFKHKYIMRNQLRDHLRTIKNEPKINTDLKLLKSNLLKYQVTNPYDKKVIRSEQFQNLTKGIYCAACFSFDLILHKKFSITCKNCHVKESKIETLKRLASEVGIYKYGERITSNDIHRLSNNQFSKPYLSRHLKKVLQLNRRGTYANYDNPNELPNWRSLIKQFTA